MTQDRKKQTATPKERRTPKDIQQHVTDTIISQLETGTLPWQKPWEDNGLTGNPFALPKNVTTGNAYRGINIPLLWIAADQNNYPTQEWASFKQWQVQKQQVAAGQKGTLIIYYDTFEKEAESGEVEKIPFIKASYVFNRCQLQGYVPEEQPASEERPLMQRLSAVDGFLANTGANIIHSGNRACYSPSTDTIWMPEESRFIKTETSTAQESYYSTLLHELGHWSGPRLNRDQKGKFRSKSYAHEELVAELGSAFLCAELEITNTPRPDHASYLASWLKVLQDDKRAIFQAASEASRACDYLRRFQDNSDDATAVKETAPGKPLSQPAAGLRS